MVELPGPWRAARRWGDAAFGPQAPGVLLLLGLVVVVQLDFALRDGRLPHDSNAALRHVPELAEALSSGRAGEALAVLGRSGGWQELAVAVLALTTGRSTFAWHAWFTGWLLLALVGLARAARAVREDAVLPALALAVGFPVLLEQARIGWIHLPELALILTVLAVLLEGDRPLGARAALGVGGALALIGCLRGSGLAWAGLLAVAALVRSAPATGPVTTILGGLGVGLLVTGPELTLYATEKLGAAQRYASLGGAFGLVLLRQALGIVESWIVAFAVGLGLVAWPAGRRLALAGIVVAGIVVPLVSVFVLSAPVTNTPVFLGAAALVGGVGLASGGRWGVGAALLVSVPALLLQFVPSAVLQGIGQPMGWERYWRDDPQNYQRIYAESVAPAVAERVAACLARQVPCGIVAEAGLFGPTPEEPGRLELFFLGFGPSDVVLVPPTEVRPVFPVDVVARYRCQGATEGWARRHPGYAEAAAALIVERGLSRTLDLPAGPRCEYLWSERP